MALQEPVESSRSTVFTSDKVLQPFFSASFDPAEFFNNALPPWTSLASTQAPDTGVTLVDLSTQTQAILSQFNAQLTRLSNTLTQLTNDILRSGGRLAYEVEVLRSDSSTLADVLTGSLHNDITKFLPHGLNAKVDDTAITRTATNGRATPLSEKPDCVSKLQTLTLVRTRLESVIKVFGDAEEWVLPPSTINQSSIMSVAAPESTADIESREIKGLEYMEKLRGEISDLASESLQVGDREAIETATRRVESLRELATVWKGTVEERARAKFVDSLTTLLNQERG